MKQYPERETDSDRPIDRWIDASPCKVQSTPVNPVHLAATMSSHPAATTSRLASDWMVIEQFRSVFATQHTSQWPDMLNNAESFKSLNLRQCMKLLWSSTPCMEQSLNAIRVPASMYPLRLEDFEIPQYTMDFFRFILMHGVNNEEQEGGTASQRDPSAPYTLECAQVLMFMMFVAGEMAVPAQLREDVFHIAHIIRKFFPEQADAAADAPEKKRATPDRGAGRSLMAGACAPRSAMLEERLRAMEEKLNVVVRLLSCRVAE